MGKIRVAVLGDESSEKKQRKEAEKRRQAKKDKKKIEGIGLKGGERVTAVDGDEIKSDVKELLEQPTQPEKKSDEKKEKKARVRSKRYQDVRMRVNRDTLYPLKDAVSLVKQTATTKFDATVELHVTTMKPTDKEKGDTRGSVKLPHSTGKDVRVAIASDEVVQDVAAGKINFDILVAHPSMMPKLAKVARTLGPKGLMPNPKNGTVTPDPEKKAKELSAGTVNFKSEPGQPNFHLRVGKASFEDKQLIDNINAYLDAIGRIKLSKVTLSSSMGPGVKVQLQ